MADARTAFLITTDLNHEGGFQNSPTDSGNWTGGSINSGELKGTNYGVSAAQFPDLDIKNLTREDAIKIYIEGYWKSLYSQIESQIVANKLADMGVLFGVHEAVKMLQAALSSAFNLKLDGSFGPETLSAVNQSEEESLLEAYKATLVTLIFQIAAAHPEKRDKVAGWGRRINS